MTTDEQPLSRREFYDAILPNLATKADLAELKAELMTAIAQLEAKLVKWMVGLMVASIVGASTLAFTAVRLFGA